MGETTYCKLGTPGTCERHEVRFRKLQFMSRRILFSAWIKKRLASEIGISEREKSQPDIWLLRKQDGAKSVSTLTTQRPRPKPDVFLTPQRAPEIRAQKLTRFLDSRPKPAVSRAPEYALQAISEPMPKRARAEPVVAPALHHAPEPRPQYPLQPRVPQMFPQDVPGGQDEEQALQDVWSKTPPKVLSKHARKVITVSHAPLRFTKSVRSLSNLLNPSNGQSGAVRGGVVDEAHGHLAKCGEPGSRLFRCQGGEGDRAADATARAERQARDKPESMRKPIPKPRPKAMPRPPMPRPMPYPVPRPPMLKARQKAMPRPMPKPLPQPLTTLSNFSAAFKGVRVRIRTAAADHVPWLQNQ